MNSQNLKKTFEVFSLFLPWLFFATAFESLLAALLLLFIPSESELSFARLALLGLLVLVFLAGIYLGITARRGLTRFDWVLSDAFYFSLFIGSFNLEPDSVSPALSQHRATPPLLPAPESLALASPRRRDSIHHFPSPRAKWIPFAGIRQTQTCLSFRTDYFRHSFFHLSLCCHHQTRHHSRHGLLGRTWRRHPRLAIRPFSSRWIRNPDFLVTHHASLIMHHALSPPSRHLPHRRSSLADRSRGRIAK